MLAAGDLNVSYWHGGKTLIFNHYNVTVAAVFMIYSFALFWNIVLFHVVTYSYPADLAYMFLATQSSEHSKTHSNYSTSVLAPPPKTLPSKPSDICQFVRKILSKCQVWAFDVLGWKFFFFVRLLALHMCLLGFSLWKHTHGWHQKDGHRLPTWCPHSTFLALPIRSFSLLLTNPGQKWPFVPHSEVEDANAIKDKMNVLG